MKAEKAGAGISSGLLIEEESSLLMYRRQKKSSGKPSWMSRMRGRKRLADMGRKGDDIESRRKPRQDPLLKCTKGAKESADHWVRVLTGNFKKKKGESDEVASQSAASLSEGQ